MNTLFRLVVIFSILPLLFSCKKESTPEQSCLSDAVLSRVIVNKAATVKLTSGQFYIIEQGTIDTKLIPCNLSQEFQVADLQVIISGDVKAIPQPAMGPCCTENLVITKITR